MSGVRQEDSTPAAVGHRRRQFQISLTEKKQNVWEFVTTLNQVAPILTLELVAAERQHLKLVEEPNLGWNVT